MELGVLLKEINASKKKEIGSIAIGFLLVIGTVIFRDFLGRYTLWLLIPLPIVFYVCGGILIASGVMLIISPKTKPDVIELYEYGVKTGAFEATYPSLTIRFTSKSERGRLVFVTQNEQYIYPHPLSDRNIEFIEKTISERH